LERQRPERRHDAARDRPNEPHQPGQRTLEPGEGTRDGVAALDVLPDLFLADQLHESADQRVGRARDGIAGDRVLAEDRLEEVVASRALRERRQGPQDRLLDQVEQFAHHTDAERDQAVDRIGEDPLGAVPHVAEVEDVPPTQRVDEAFESVDDHPADVAERRDLPLDPVGGLVDHAVVVEHLRDQRPARDQLDQRPQEVGRRPRRTAHVDRVESEHQRQHPEAGDVVRLVGEVVERVPNTEPLDGGWRAGRGHRRRLRSALHFGRTLLGALDGGALLDRVRELVGQQVSALGGARLVLVAREEDVVAVGERPGAEVVAQAGGALVGMDADVAQIRVQPRLHEPAHLGRQRLAAGRRPLDLGLRVGRDAPCALAEPLDRWFGGDGPLDRRRRWSRWGRGGPRDRVDRPHHLVGGTVGLLLQRIGGLAHRELGLHEGLAAGLAHHGGEEARAAGCLEEAAGSSDGPRVRLGRLGRGRPHRPTAIPPAAADPSRGA
jgi:hypothetical protein